MPASEAVLIHWTGRAQTDDSAFAVLRSICMEKLLRLAFCPTFVRDEFKSSVSMACFTDIPLSQSARHCERFGRCGIAFRKDALVSYGANPVFYTTALHFNRIVSLSALIDQMVDLEKDREWRGQVEPNSFTENQTHALLELFCFMQEYGYKGKEDDEAINYAQREWRLAFRALPFANEGVLQRPGMSSFYSRDGRSYSTVAFAPEDVSFLVVPRQFQSEAASLAAALRCGVRVFEDEVSI